MINNHNEKFDPGDQFPFVAANMLIHAVHLLSFKEERNSYFRSWGGALPFRTRERT